MNQSQTIDLQVKLSLEIPNKESIVKRIATAQTYKELLAQCDIVCTNAGVPKGHKVRLSYRDSDGDKIDVTDDYELQMAYATALSADCKVKFFVELPGYQPPKVEEPKVEEPKVEEPKVEEPKIEEPKVEEPKPEPVVEQPVVEQPLIKEESQPVVEKPAISADLEEEKDSLSDHEHHHHKGKKGKGGKGKGKKGKHGHGHMPRKAIQNLIRAELETAVPGLFDKLMNQSETESQSTEESKEPKVRHIGVECDSCGVCPIEGIRYKCSVRKDFDLCEKCEETLDHEYPFLKIRKPGGAPSVIITVLNEEAQGEPTQQPDWQQMKQAWKQIRQQFKPEGSCKWPREKQWTDEQCAEKMQFWKNIAGNFMKNMGMDCNKQDWQKMKEHWKTMKQEWKQNCGKDWKNDDWSEMKKNWCSMRDQWKQQNGCHDFKTAHKVKRAILIKKIDEILECQPGCVILQDIEVQNSTHWPWKQGCYLSLDSSVDQKDMPIELINVPVEQKVEGMEVCKMTVPICVLETVKPSDKPFEFSLRFRGPKGGEYGEPIPLKLKIVAPKVPEVIKPAEEPVKKSHLELVKIAVKLFDAEKLGQTFNECLEVVTLVNGDEEVAKKSLQPRQ